MHSQAQNPIPPAHAPELLQQTRNVLRLHHYSIHTERTYIDWITRYVQFHRMKSRADLQDGEQKIEAFLTDLAVNGKVAAATRNQAMNALVFLYRKVLQIPLGESIWAVVSKQKCFSVPRSISTFYAPNFSFSPINGQIVPSTDTICRAILYGEAMCPKNRQPPHNHERTSASKSHFPPSAYQFFSVSGNFRAPGRQRFGKSRVS